MPNVIRLDDNDLLYEIAELSADPHHDNVSSVRLVELRLEAQRRGITYGPARAVS